MFTQRRLRTYRAAIVAAGLAALASIGTQAASAAQPADTAVSVRYADLNLNTDAGAATLYDRLQVAAQQVCGAVNARDVARQGAAARCRNEVVAEAVSHISSPQLAAVFAARTHHATHSPV